MFENIKETEEHLWKMGSISFLYSMITDSLQSVSL